MSLQLLPWLRSLQQSSLRPWCSLGTQHLRLPMLGLQGPLLRLPRLRPLTYPVQGLAGFRPYPQTALQLPAQGLAGHRPLLLLVLLPSRRGLEEPVGVIWAPASPIRCLSSLLVASALPVGVLSLLMAAAILALGFAPDGRPSSQLRRCSFSVRRLGHWPCRRCLLVTSSWLRPCAEDSFLAPLFS